MIQSLSELQQIISGAYNSQTGQFVLSISLLNSNTCNTIASGYLKNQTITINNAVYAVTNTGASITGTGVDYPYNNCSVVVDFYLDNNSEAQFLILGTAPSGWNISIGLPPFNNSIVESLPFLTGTAIISLSTDDANSEYPYAMYFSGTADLLGFSGGLSGILNLNSCYVEGPIVLKNAGSTLSAVNINGKLASDISLPFGSLSELDLSIGYTIYKNAASGNNSAYPFLKITAQLPFSCIGSNNQPVIISLALSITDPAGPFRFSANISSLIEATVDELAIFFNGSDFAGLLPSANQIDSILVLDELFIDIDFNSPLFVSIVGISIKNRSPWNIYTIETSNQQLTLDDININVSFIEPFGAAFPAISFSGQVNLTDVGSIRLYAQYANNWVLQAYMAENSGLSVTGLLELFLGSPAGIPYIELTELAFSAQSSSYTLNMTAATDWLLAPLPAAVEGFSVALNYNPGYESHYYLKGVFTIANSVLYISADYPGASGEWIFRGGTAPGQSISIGNLMDDLLGVFNVDATVPAFLENFIISELATTFNTLTKDFTFHCTGAFQIYDKPVTITVDVRVLQQPDKSYEKTFAGRMTLLGKQFDLIFDTSTAETFFIANYYDLDGAEISIRDLIMEITSDQSLYNLVPEGLSFAVKDALFSWRSDGNSHFMFAIDWDMGVNLSNLPLVGQYFNTDETLTLEFVVTYCSDASFTATVVSDLNALLPPNTISFPVSSTDSNNQSSSGGLPAGIGITTRMRLGGTAIDIPLPVVVNPSTGQLSSPSGSNSVSPIWYNIQKTFGPVYFKRVGVMYNSDNGRLYFYLDASMNTGGLSIALTGLSLSTQLTDFSSIAFDLQGLSIDYSAGPVQIGGAFLHAPQLIDGVTWDSYSGTAIIEAEGIGLAAIGSYAQNPATKEASLFIYGALNLPLGGPPFFVVSGLSGGFGYNRALIVPSLDKILQFPLVEEAVLLSGGGTASSLNEMLTSLSTYIPPSVGEYWLAAGISFTSFKVIDAFVLLTAAFGNKFQFNLLGLATIVAPPDAGASDPLAELQLAIAATFDVDSGYIGVQGQLTSNSFILSRSLKLTGGFALCTWLSGDHAGDFVVSAGGYHPKLKIPSYYPTVPRLGFNWQVNSSLLLKGELYYALTPGAMMAGGLLQATWKEGNFAAWFTTSADFFIGWKPFTYSAEMGVSIGASYTFDKLGIRKTITAQVAANLNIWGPDFSGTAHVDLSVISFDVAFGTNRKQSPAPISWDEFRNSFIPDQPLSAATASGQIGMAADGSPVLNPYDFEVALSSVIPITFIVSNQQNIATNSYNIFMGIAPMNQEDTIQTLTIGLTSPDGGSLTDHFNLTATYGDFPYALWGHGMTPVLNDSPTLSRNLNGLRLLAKPITQDSSRQAFASKSYMSYQTQGAEFMFSYETELITFFFDETFEGAINEINTSITNPSTVDNRNQLLGLMGIDAPITVTTEFADMFTDAPEILFGPPGVSNDN